MLRNNNTLVADLLKNRRKKISESELLNEVFLILEQNELERQKIKINLKTECSTNSNSLNFDLLDSDKIFHIDQIQKVCIDYRLRFLDTTLFKNSIPEEAISKINALEKEHLTTLKGFKIMEPSKAFNLKKYDDPLLFVPIGNDYYYLIHQWGTDLNAYRKLMVLPVKNIINFIFFCLIVSFIGTYLTSSNPLSRSVSFAPIIIFLFMFKSIVGVIAYYFFMMGKNFNNMIWNRPFKEN